MPEKGDTTRAYCGYCKMETTWTFLVRIFKKYWKCMGCGTEREVGWN
jgi:hypothetical protein